MKTVKVRLRVGRMMPVPPLRPKHQQKEPAAAGSVHTITEASAKDMERRGLAVIIEE